MGNVIGRIKKELLYILPAFVFFLVMFQIIAVTRALTLKAYGVTVRASAIATIGALVVAKAILISDKWPFLNLYPRKPLIWNVILKMTVFSVITLLFLFIEELFHESHQHNSFVIGYEQLKTGIVWPAFLAREIWVTILLLFYCSSIELFRIVGIDRIKEIFFGSKKI